MVTATSSTAAAPVTATAVVTGRQNSGTPTDLQVAKSGPATATAGEAVVYRIVVTNGGPATATAVSLVDALPDGVIFSAASSTQGLCDGGVSCLLGDMGVGMTATVVVTGLVSSGVVSGTSLVNDAFVQSANLDSDPSNNSSTYTTTVQASALLRIAKSVTPSAAVPGATIVYRIVVTNGGPSLAHEVTVSDAVPAAIEEPLVSSSQGGCTGLVCRLGDIAPGASATILIVGTVAGGASGVIENTAAVTSTTALATGSVTESTAALAVGAMADLAIFEGRSGDGRGGQQHYLHPDGH